jgi:predicted ABC-type ATPase
VSRLDLVVGPNGAGKSTFVAKILGEVLPARTSFVNADEIAKSWFPGEEMERSLEAGRMAAATRRELLRRRLPFIAETVFSHPSKLQFLDDAIAAGYYVNVHVLAVPVELAVARVRYRVADGGHGVPEHKIVERWERLWPLVAEAVRRADRAEVWDNSRQHHTRKIAAFVGGLPSSPPEWPRWAPSDLRELA